MVGVVAIMHKVRTMEMCMLICYSTYTRPKAKFPGIGMHQVTYPSYFLKYSHFLHSVQGKISYNLSYSYPEKLQDKQRKGYRIICPVLNVRIFLVVALDIMAVNPRA